MSNVIIPSTSEDRKSIRDAIHEVSNSLARIEGEREHINDVLTRLEEEYELPKKYARQIAKMYHKDTASEVKAEFSDIEALYENIIGSAFEMDIAS